MNPFTAAVEKLKARNETAFETYRRLALSPTADPDALAEAARAAGRDLEADASLISGYHEASELRERAESHDAQAPELAKKMDAARKMLEAAQLVAREKEAQFNAASGDHWRNLRAAGVARAEAERIETRLQKVAPEFFK